MRFLLITTLVLTACSSTVVDGVPDFRLEDVNPASPTAGQQVGPADFEGEVSAWYFGWATCPLCQAHVDELDAMASELAELDTPVPITILGINEVGRESANATITEGLTLPWLQDTAQVDVFAAWPPAQLRELKIVGRDGEVATTFDLNVEDPRDEAPRQAMLDAMVQAANTEPAPDDLPE